MKKLVFFTGSGISAESGLATFRDSNGLWTKVNADEFASIRGYRKNRAKVLEFYNERRKQLFGAEPNHAHQVIASLEQQYNVTIITQNVDNLHERAGSTNVLHMHGELTKVTSSLNPNNPDCIHQMALDQPIRIGDKAADGSQLRPYVVLFGESVPNFTDAKRICAEADIFVIIGTSLVVQPAATLISSVLPDKPCYIIDPCDVDLNSSHNWFHIRTTAVKGIDLLKQKLFI